MWLTRVLRAFEPDLLDLDGLLQVIPGPVPPAWAGHNQRAGHIAQGMQHLGDRLSGLPLFDSGCRDFRGSRPGFLQQPATFSISMK